MTELGVDVTFDIVEGRIVGLVLLGITDEGEEPFGIFLLVDIVVDQTDEEALALRALGESLLEIVLAGNLSGGGSIELLGAVGELEENLTVLGIVVIIQALVEEGLCLGIVSG